VAEALAEEFDCKLYDRELLNLAAHESGFSEKFFEQTDEHKGFLKNLYRVHAPMLSGSNFYKNQFSEESLFQFQSDAIRRAASQGSCVFVGRCADYVLRESGNRVSIFLSARIEDRVKRVARRHEWDEATARKFIHSQEKQRASYYNYYTGKHWGAAESYDLCLNTSLLGIEGTAKFAAEFIRKSVGDL